MEVFVGWFIALPIGFRLSALFLIGLYVGALINWAIYQLCWNPRPISPWSAPHEKAPPRHWSDRIPFIGWMGLARENECHGRLFWIRPMLIELACGTGLAWLYLWETVDEGLHQWAAHGIPLNAVPPSATLHAQFAAHAVLITFLIAATFIDFDEKTIPDWITIPGTLLGLLLAAWLPNSPLSDFAVQGGVLIPASLRLMPKSDVPAWIYGAYGLLAGVLCLVGWWYALLPKLFYFRGGIAKAIRFFGAKALRYRFTLYLTILFVLSATFTAAIWAWGSPDQWLALLSALIGMAFGGAMVWAFRVVASAVLGQEAMGFGDVTLMAMMGTYLGWQPILLVFFIAPFAGLVIAVIQWLFTRKKEIAYGPYLALGAVILILNWPRIWSRAFRHFDVLGWWIPAILVVCLGLMAAMLTFWMMIKRRLFSR